MMVPELYEMFNDSNTTYMSEALKRNEKIDNYDKVIKSTIGRCELLLERWDDLKLLRYASSTRIGPSMMHVSSDVGICENADINRIGLNVKYMIFKSWDKFKFDENNVNGSFTYPVDCGNEYQTKTNLFENDKRKHLLIHTIKCLKEIYEAIK